MAGAPLMSPLAFQNSAKMTVMTPPAQTKPPPAKFEIAPLTQEQLAQALTYLLKVSGFCLFVCFWLCCCFDYIVNITPLYQPLGSGLVDKSLSLARKCSAAISANQPQFLGSGLVDNSLWLAEKYHGALSTNHSQFLESRLCDNSLWLAKKCHGTLPTNQSHYPGSGLVDRSL